MSDTPRTESEWKKLYRDGSTGYQMAIAMRIWAKQLERELAEARKELSEWRTLRSWGGTPQIVDDFIKGQQTRIYVAQDAENQRDTMEEALHKITGDRGEASAVSLSEAQQIADAVLAAVKGGDHE